MTTTTGLIGPLPTKVNAPYAFTNEQRFATTAGVVPVNLSRDRTTVFGVGKTGSVGLYTINDTTGVATLIRAFTERTVAAVETYDGEMLAVNGNGGSSSVWKSTGWAASKANATWAKVLDLPGGTPTPDYSANRWSMGTNGVMAIGEQGAQSVYTTLTGDNAADNATALASNASKACRAYVTANNGATWFTLYNQMTQAPLREPRQIGGTHLHAVQYDEEWDRMWITYGDNVGEGINLYGDTKIQVIYSDDWRNVLTGGTATWTAIPLFPDYASNSALQMVGMLITPKAIIMGPDGVPFAPLIIQRLGYREMGTIRFGPMMPLTNGTAIIGKDTTWAGPGFPIFSGFNIANSSLEPFSALLPRIYASADQGVNWFEIWRDPVRTRRPTDRVVAFGPTVNNKVVGNTFDTGSGASANGYIITWDLVKNQ